MAQEKLVRWQEALNKWDKWVDAVNKTSNEILDYVKKKEDKDISQIISLAEWSYICNTAEDGVSEIRLDVNETSEAKLLWRLHQKVSHQGSKFIAKVMSLAFEFEFHHIFLDYWMRSVLGYKDEAIQIDAHSEARTIRLQSRIENDNMINHVSWDHSEWKLSEVAKRLSTIEWPFDEQYVRSYNRGGRPREEHRKDIEAILSCILRYKYKETFEEIADKFGWSSYDDSQEKRMSKPVLERLQRGRNLIRENGIPIELPANK